MKWVRLIKPESREHAVSDATSVRRRVHDCGPLACIVAHGRALPSGTGGGDEETWRAAKVRRRLFAVDRLTRRTRRARQRRHLADRRPRRDLRFARPDGAGKSTLVRQLVGCSDRTAAAISVFGRDLAERGLAARATAYLAQEEPARTNGRDDGVVLDRTVARCRPKPTPTPAARKPAGKNSASRAVHPAPSGSCPAVAPPRRCPTPP